LRVAFKGVQPCPAVALRVLIAGAEVELVPVEIAGHPSVRKAADLQGRRPSEILLDQNVHGTAMPRLDDGKRRGRPDIVHYTLLTLLESPLAKQGRVEVAIHTRHGLLVRVRKDTRLPRGEARFQGLLGKVLREGASHDKDPLLWVEEECTPAEALAAFAKGPVLRLDEGGPLLAPAELVSQARGDELTVVLGGFPSGAFDAAWVEAAPEAASIWPEALNAWAVAAELAAAYRWHVPGGPAKPPS
jgi:rRNA small subunit pseudouridine methyltransferase Nep1